MAERGNISDLSNSLRYLVYIALALLFVSACTGIALVVIFAQASPEALEAIYKIKQVLP